MTLPYVWSFNARGGSEVPTYLPSILISIHRSLTIRPNNEIKFQTNEVFSTAALRCIGLKWQMGLLSL